MRRTLFSTKEKSSGSFFLVLLACLFQGQFYKTQLADFSHHILWDSLITSCMLVIVVVVCYFLLTSEPLSPKNLTKLIEMQKFEVSYFVLSQMYLGLILVSSGSQYLMHKNETELNWWHSLVSSAIAVSLGFLARYLSSYLCNRRINAIRLIETTSHFPL